MVRYSKTSSQHTKKRSRSLELITNNQIASTTLGWAKDQELRVGVSTIPYRGFISLVFSWQDWTGPWLARTNPFSPTAHKLREFAQPSNDWLEFFKILYATKPEKKQKWDFLSKNNVFISTILENKLELAEKSFFDRIFVESVSSWSSSRALVDASAGVFEPVWHLAAWIPVIKVKWWSFA